MCAEGGRERVVARVALLRNERRFVPAAEAGKSTTKTANQFYFSQHVGKEMGGSPVRVSSRATSTGNRRVISTSDSAREPLIPLW